MHACKTKKVLILSSVFIARANEFDVDQALRRAFGFFKLHFKSEAVAIKLNLCSLKLRETAATSDPLVVEQLVKVLNEYGATVRLVESDSTDTDVDLAFDYLGFKALEKKYDVKCVNISRDSYSRKMIDGYHLKSVKVSKTIEEAGFFISHPKLKTHTMLSLTAALKNQFGCIMKARKSVFHPHIHEVISDVNLAFKPDLVVMDGIIAMTKYGPTQGIPKRLNMLVTSEDPVAIDCFGANVLGLNPNSIPYMKLAYKKGLGDMNYKLYGDSVDDLKVKNFYFGMISTLLRHFISF